MPTEQNKNLVRTLTEDPYKPLWYLPRYSQKQNLHKKLRMILKCDVTTVTVGSDVKICAAWYPKPPPKDKSKPIQKFKDKPIKNDVLLVLIPGFGGSQNSWGIAQTAQRAFEMFSWRTVVYNRPGYGAPNLPNQGEEKYYLHRFDFFGGMIESNPSKGNVFTFQHANSPILETLVTFIDFLVVGLGVPDWRDHHCSVDD